ncbi:DUF998 domain-containing protein [Pseudonocardia hispaniensis]|uniref:DUF998 domain-containing protein n=1 Tax=Pseudonocardia hispaniensis TaxID=904933 RepID=A0ABW1IY38_9PSEU
MTVRGRESGVLGCVIIALFPVGFLHHAGSAAVDPLARTISDYIVVPGGYELLGISALALAAAGGLLAAGLLQRRLPGAVPLAGLLVSWSVALVLVAVFPTNAPGAPPDIAAAVHRCAGAWVFAGLPMVTWLIARHGLRGAPGLARLALTTGLLSTAFLLSHVPIVVFGSPGFPLLGLVERVLYGVVIVLLLATANACAQARVAAGSVPAVASAGGTGE